ncbi:MAG TPA: ABC transporter permease [Candidatus Kapabacteria bacterium]|nr:ABC transporter permease [Candidatus Kapabacteria bacterium]
MSFPLFIAKRYSLTKRKEQFITTISILSMLGITVGVAALICVLSVFNGFSKVVTDILVNFDPHVRINAVASDTTNGKFIADGASVISMVKQLPEVEAAGPVAREKGVLVHYTLPRVASVIGIDASDLERVSGIGRTIGAGKMQLDDSGIVVGQALADNLAIATGDTIQVFSSTGMERILSEPVTPRSRYFYVRGIFAANNRDYDATNAYININTARELFEIPQAAATQIDIRLHDIHESQNVKTTIENKLGKNFSVQTWYDLHTDLYNVMEIERWIAYIILILIVAVASFSIFSALTLTVFEKRRDIGLLSALGAEQSQIRKIFLGQGLITGVGGVIIGCVLGFLVVWSQDTFHWFKLDSSIYIIPAMPVELHLLDFLSVSLGALILVVLASIFPARRAASTEIAEALRWE